MPSLGTVTIIVAKVSISEFSSIQIGKMLTSSDDEDYGVPMRFESRDLKPLAEPVLAADLKKEEIYFLLNFLDHDMKIPLLKTLVYLGQTESGRLQFQDAESYNDAVRDKSAGIDEPKSIFECEQRGVVSLPLTLTHIESR